MKQYVFTFLGEFGYELLNWQGVVRKFRTRAPAGTGIIVCSRAGMEPFYESADEFVDISGIESYRRSVAGGYTVLGNSAPQIVRDVRSQVLRTHPQLEGRELELVWSHEDRTIEGLRFGGGGIYANLDLGNNLFRRIEPDLRDQAELERELGFSLAEPFVLCQAARREIVMRAPGRVPVERMLETLARRICVVLLNFDTGRALDSYSLLPKNAHSHSLKAESFPRQGCLIHFARACLFFTEGDFRSHMYVPPFVGKDVHAVAPAAVYEVGGFGGVNTAPIEFWNETVFRFGGRIKPWNVESVCRDDDSLNAFADQIVA